MPDEKHQHESTSDDAIPLPTRPPKQPRKDYSALPQKPITLKREVSTSPALKKREPPSKRKAGTRTEPIPKPKSVKAKRPATPPPSPWAQLDLSPKANAAALSAAQQEGITLSEWLEQVILQHTAEQAPAQPAEVESELAESLKSIDERLGRLENQRGFWLRFWDRFMEPR